MIRTAYFELKMQNRAELNFIKAIKKIYSVCIKDKSKFPIILLSTPKVKYDRRNDFIGLKEI